MSLRVGLSRVGLILPRGSRVSVSKLLLLHSRLNSSIAASGAVGKHLLSLKGDLRNRDVIHRDLPLLTWAVRQSTERPKSPLLGKNDFEIMLETLASSALPDDLARIEQVLLDMNDVYNTPPTPETHTVIIRGLLQNGKFHSANNWLDSMHKKPGGIQPIIEHYHMLLSAISRFSSVAQVVSAMRNSGYQPTNETFRIIARVRWRTTHRISKSPVPSDFTPIFEEMKDFELPYDTDVVDMLNALYTEKGLYNYADEILNIYDNVFAESLTPAQSLELKWRPLFSEAVKRRDFTAGMELYTTYIADGGEPSTRLLGILARRAKNLQQLVTLRDTFGVEPTPEQWSTILRRDIQRGIVRKAITSYQSLHQAGKTPTVSAMLGLLQLICADGSDQSTDVAVRIFTMYVASLPEHCDTLPSETQRSLADLYGLMLRELAHSPETFSDVEQSILEEAKARGISIQKAGGHSTTLRMNSAKSESDAIEAYRQTKHILDEAGYLSVLDVLSRLSWSDRVAEPKVPNIADYFEVVKDMKAAGITITTTVYIILLRSLGQLGTRTLRSVGLFHLQNRVVSAIRRTHDLITLDSAITPDLPLWNLLLDTYGRVRLFAEVYRLWDTMYISRSFDRTSINLVLAACGEAGGDGIALRVKSKLQMIDVAFDNSNWKAYIKCLCQVGKLNEALKDMCTVVENPDPEMAHIILDRVKPEVRQKVMSRIERFQPALYDALIHETKNI